MTTLVSGPHPIVRPAIGFDLMLFSGSAGVFERPATPEHLLALHASGPVLASCRCDGRHDRRVQRRGDIDIVPAGLPGTWEEDGPSTVFAIALPPSLLATAAESLGIHADRIEIAPQLHLRDPMIEHIGWALQADYEAGHPGGGLLAESLGLALSAHLVRRYAAGPVYRQGLSKPQRRRVLDFIDTHLDQDLPLVGLASIAGVSASHFKALFRQSLGMPVHQYVIQRRVERAKTLLLDSDMAMSEVALAAGFAHQSHMASCMRRLLGAAPSEVRRCRL
ncbi:MAG TPA: AraC family transcriptional regulator [Aliidongia sp.]|nr:AraC family transcriptional regulator [Aliidongia sp.]